MHSTALKILRREKKKLVDEYSQIIMDQIGGLQTDKKQRLEEIKIELMELEDTIFLLENI